MFLFLLLLLFWATGHAISCIDLSDGPLFQPVLDMLTRKCFTQLKIWKLKQQQEAAAAAEASNGESGTGTSSGGTSARKKKVTGAQLRVQKDLSDLNLPSTMELQYPDPEDIMNFQVLLRPDEGMYRGGTFRFSFEIGPNFPHEPPRVRCLQKVYHPNIDLQGNVCLNILREDWKPVLNIDSVLVGLQFLFLEPNSVDPLNKTAAKQLQENRERFKQIVKNTMAGGYDGSERFDDVLTRW